MSNTKAIATWAGDRLVELEKQCHQQQELLASINEFFGRRERALLAQLEAVNAKASELKSALAAQGAEPVAWMDDFGNAFPLAANKGAGSWLDEYKRKWRPLYARPPAAEQSEALKDAELLEAATQALSALETYAQTYNDYWEHGMDILEPIADAAIPRLRAAIASAEGGRS